MNQEALAILLKTFPVAASILVLGLAGIKAAIKYRIKKDEQDEAFHREQADKKEQFYKQQISKKDEIIESKDNDLKALNNQLIILITKNLEVSNALQNMIKKALQRYKTEED